MAPRLRPSASATQAFASLAKRAPAGSKTSVAARESNAMIFDHRTYTVRPGTLAKHLKLYEEYGLAAQKRHLGEPLLYAITETGEINTYVHVWV